jgi:hypothetical protein
MNVRSANGYRKSDPKLDGYPLRGIMELDTQRSKSRADHSPIGTDDKIISLFEPDTLLSAQYLENLRGKTLLEPEKKLMLAVLADAINCFQVNVMAQSGRGKKLFNEAEDWLMEQDNDWIFSFVSVCELLRFNPEYMRRGLLRWKEEKLARNPMSHSWEKKMMAGYNSATSGRS